MATRAIHHALELSERPSLVGLMRQQALPPDMTTLIRIAAGSPESLAEEATRTGRSARTIEAAAVLYLQQILFHSEADAYRILGLARSAPQEELGQHMRLLMKWLHPDRHRSEWESAFAERVSGAWDNLKSAERRARYDQSLAADRGTPSRGGRSRRRRVAGIRRLPSVERVAEADRPRASVKLIVRSAAALALVAIAIAVLMMPETALLGPGSADVVADPVTAGSVGGN